MQYMNLLRICLGAADVVLGAAGSRNVFPEGLAFDPPCKSTTAAGPVRDSEPAP